jgi:uncharacterized protein YjgD (DUF1641 family)
MSKKPYETIKTLLASTKPEDLYKGLNMVKQEIPKADSEKAKSLFEMVSVIFYIDLLDHPELTSILDEAINIAVSFGDWIIPILLEQLDSSDLKAQMAIGHALGRIGSDAIKPLVNEYQSTTEPARQTFILYAMGKIKSPEILRAAHLALKAAESPNFELRDTATRAIGKFAESIPPSDLPEDLREAFFERLQNNIEDANPGIRAKAIRSLGKLAKHGHLNAAEREKLKTICQVLMGTDEAYSWDRAYVVRKEAEETLRHTLNKPLSNT